MACSKYNLTNVIAFYECEDNAANTTVVDGSGRGNNATADVNTDTLTITGKVNNGFALLENNQITTPAILDLTNDFSTKDFAVALWFQSGYAFPANHGTIFTTN